MKKEKQDVEQTLFETEDGVTDSAIEVVEVDNAIEPEEVSEEVSEEESPASLLAKQMQEPIDDDDDDLTYAVPGEMMIGDCKFGITCTG